MVEQNADFQYSWQIGLKMHRKDQYQLIFRLVDLVTWAARDSNERLALIAAATEKVCELSQFKGLHPHPAENLHHSETDDRTPLDPQLIEVERKLGGILRTADYIRARRGEPLPLLSVIKKVGEEFSDDPDFTRVLIRSYILDGFQSALGKVRAIHRIAGAHGVELKNENK